MNIQELNRKVGLLRPGWWIVHVIGIVVVYTLGALLGGYL